jgi:Ca-activated chloride channel family protein
MTNVDQLRLKRRVVASLPAILLTYTILGLLGQIRPARDSTLPQGPGGLYLGRSDDENERVPAPAMGTEITVDITGIVARVRVTQIFENPSTRWVEGTYLFALPDDAVVDDL